MPTLPRATGKARAHRALQAMSSWCGMLCTPLSDSGSQNPQDHVDRHSRAMVEEGGIPPWVEGRVAGHRLTLATIAPAHGRGEAGRYGSTK